MSDLKPANDFAKNYGVKALVYGAPGSAKTPLINTTPRPLMLACEPGLLSMRGSNVPTFQAFTPKAIDEFWDWFFSSNEVKNFDTMSIDSASQMMDIYLQAELSGTSNSGNKRHGQQAYGEAAAKTLKHLRQLYYTQYKHAYIICKETTDNNGMKKPYFPGQQLGVEVPHMYDEILHLGIHNVPGMGQIQSFQCHQTIDIMARDRTGILNQFEEAHFGKLIQKAMQ